MLFSLKNSKEINKQSSFVEQYCWKLEEEETDIANS